MRNFGIFVAALCLLFSGIHIGKSDEQGDASERSLRLLNTSVFGRSTDDAIVLLEPKRPGAIDPETIMVDVNDGLYFAATVDYPKESGFLNARQALNARYGKWEKASFASNPTMGLWRNEVQKFVIQLTEDDDNLQIIYIKFSMVSEDQWLKGFARALRALDSEELGPESVESPETNEATQ